MPTAVDDQAVQRTLLTPDRGDDCHGAGRHLPTQYRITVAGQQFWFAQCGFESLAITWMFPGQTVRIEAPCLDCGDPMALEMLDGRLLRIEPPEPSRRHMLDADYLSSWYPRRYEERREILEPRAGPPRFGSVLAEGFL